MLHEDLRRRSPVILAFFLNPAETLRLTDAARDYCHANNWAYSPPAPRRLERDQHLTRVTLCRRSNIRHKPAHQSNWLSGTPTVRAYAMTPSRRCSSPCW